MSDIEQLASTVELEGRVIVDVGCGAGAFVRELAAAGAEAIGIEVLEEAVARARAQDPRHRYLLGGAQELPLPDKSVDGATLMRSLHHVPDPSRAFPELARVVRDFVWIAEPLPEGDFFELLKPIDDETEVRSNAQAAVSAQTAFERVETLEYALTLPIDSFEDLKACLLAPDPARIEQFARFEPSLRERFTPGGYTIPMRADLLRVASR